MLRRLLDRLSGETGKQPGQCFFYPGDIHAWLGATPAGLEDRLREFDVPARGHAFPEPGDWESYDDVPAPTGEACQSTALHRRLAVYPACLTGDLMPCELSDPPGAQLLRVWSRRLAAHETRVIEQFDRHKPDTILLVQGYEPNSAIARAVGIRRGVPLLAFENTALADRLLWDDVSGITVNRNQAANYYARYRDSITDPAVEEWYEGWRATLRSRKSEEHLSPARSPALSISGPSILFLGQVYTDSSVLFGVGEWQSPVRLLAHLLAAAETLGATVVAKLHPKEKSGSAPLTARPYDQLTWRKLQQDETCRDALSTERLIVDADNEFDTYELIEACEAAVTLTSQAGLEAAMMGKPVIVAGRSFYSNLGFTHDALSPDQLPFALRDALASDRTATETEARRFGLIFFEKYCIAKTELAMAQQMRSTFARPFPRAQ